MTVSSGRERISRAEWSSRPYRLQQGQAFVLPSQSFLSYIVCECDAPEWGQEDCFPRQGEDQQGRKVILSLPCLQRCSRFWQLLYSALIRVEKLAAQNTVQATNTADVSKPPLFQRKRLTGRGNPSFESYVEGKARQREI